MKTALGIILTISILLNIGLIMFIYKSEPVPDNELSQSYPLLSKRIFSNNSNDILINFTNLRTKIKSYTAKLTPRTGIYFEYLPSGTSIGINEKEEFFPASLLKVPIVMAIYHKFELGTLKKTDIVTIKEEYIDPSSGTLWKYGANKPISIEEAIKFTLLESDNTAKNVLLSVLNDYEVEFVLDTMDMDINKSESESLITPKNYASILRSLFLSSYLTEQYSNEILQLLTQSPHNERIQSGIPSNITFAHKYGDAKATGPIPPLYSDCGIVYIPKRPFILCIFVQDDEKTATSIMKNVATMSYEYVSNTNVIR